MSIIPKKLTDAAPHEVRAYATNFLNLEMTGSESDAEVIALVTRAQPGSDQIFVQADDEALQDVEPLGQTMTINDTSRIAGSTGRGDPRVIINIPVGSGDDVISRSDVGVGVNGVVWQLKRGVDLDVPWRVVVALGLTEQDIVRHDFENDSVIVTRAMRFPVNFPRGAPDRDVIRAWHEATDDLVMP